MLLILVLNAFSQFSGSFVPPESHACTTETTFFLYYQNYYAYIFLYKNRIPLLLRNERLPPFGSLNVVETLVASIPG